LRTDIVEVYVFREPDPRAEVIEFLQILRASEPLARTWHPVMGHVEPGETAVAAAIRELREEIALDPAGASCRGMWALEQVHPFFVNEIDAIVLSPRFAACVAPGWEPTLNSEHAAHRWIAAPQDTADTAQLRAAAGHFLWPGQKQALAEVLHEIVRDESPSRGHLRIRLK
jgi:ADP-ribose pyrophosphatase YjhB (NUDIX family)